MTSWTRFLNVILYAIGLILPTLPLTGQELRTNEKGEKIIVYPDGTWQYFNNLPTSSKVLFDGKDAAESKQSDKNAYPIFDGKVAPMENRIQLTEKDAEKIVFRKAQLAQDAAQIAQKRAEEARLHRSKMEKEVALAQQNLPTDPEEIKRLRLQLESARKNEQLTSSEARLAQQEWIKAEELTQKGDLLKEWMTRQNLSLNQPGEGEPLSTDFYDQLAWMESTTAVNPAQAAATNGCKIAFQGRDEYSGRWRKDVQKQLLFTHTDERLRLFLKEKEYLRCEGYLTSLDGGYRFLSLQFSFAYPNAREAYGFIEKGSALLIRLLNGEYVRLQAGVMDQGHYDTETEILTYRVHYPIDQGLVSTLKRSEVESIIVTWSSGYEEYPVFQLDFFIHQIACLEN